MAKRLMKEIRSLRTKLPEITRGQAKLLESDSDEITSVLVRLTPTSGYYKGDVIDFKVDFTEMYPADPPIIICLSDIYHPNIDTSTIEENNVCLNLFDSDFWCEGFGIQGCVCGLLFLLENPNFEDPISPYFQPRDTLQEYIHDIRNHRKGNKVGFMASLLDEVINSSSYKSCGNISDEVGTRYQNNSMNDLKPSFDNVPVGDVVHNDQNENLESEQELNVEFGTHRDDLVLQSQKVAAGPELNVIQKTFENNSHNTKRQISEDNIVEASNKVFRKVSGESCTDKTQRRISLDERPDFEELIYRNFMYSETFL